MGAFRIGAAAIVLLAATSAMSVDRSAAAPARPEPAALTNFVASGVEPVRARRAQRRTGRRAVAAGVAAGALAAGVAAGGYGYASDYQLHPEAGPYPGHNYRASNGRIYPYCVFDEGYGRVRPCDAGGGPN